MSRLQLLDQVIDVDHFDEQLRAASDIELLAVVAELLENDQEIISRLRKQTDAPADGLIRMFIVECRRRHTTAAVLASPKVTH